MRGLGRDRRQGSAQGFKPRLERHDVAFADARRGDAARRRDGCSPPGSQRLKPPLQRHKSACADCSRSLAHLGAESVARVWPPARHLASPKPGGELRHREARRSCGVQSAKADFPRFQRRFQPLMDHRCRRSGLALAHHPRPRVREGGHCAFPAGVSTPGGMAGRWGGESRRVSCSIPFDSPPDLPSAPILPSLPSNPLRSPSPPPSDSLAVRERNRGRSFPPHAIHPCGSGAPRR